MILERFRQYQIQSQPLIEYYEKKNVFQAVDGSVSIDEVSSRIQSIVAQFVSVPEYQIA